MKDIKEIAKFIKESIEALKDGSATCCRLKLDDKLAVFVGWSAGYGDEIRDDIIQDKDEPDFGMNAGIKVWTSDDMWTDFDYINFPYYENGDVLDMAISIEPGDESDDGCKALAKDMIAWYNDVKDLEIEDDGKIVETKEDEEPEQGDEEIEESYHDNEFHDIIAEYFDYDADFEFLDIVSNVIDRVDDFTNEDDIYEAIDAELIYTSDQWIVIEHYCTPQDANFDNAFEDFTNDIYGVCAKIAEQK